MTEATAEATMEVMTEAMTEAMKEATTEAMEAIMTNQINPINQVMAILMNMSISIVSTFYIFLRLKYEVIGLLK